tara:strand:+ start:151 stop:981 length:831 start_codon:yes stop_codon:yes gene_type:complete
VGNTFRDYATSKAYIIVNFIVLCCVAGISYSIVKLDYEQHIASMRQDARQALHELSNQVQHQFQETILVTKNIENILLSGESFKDKKIELLVKELRERNPGIRAFALAPDLTITQSYPKQPNGPTIGMAYKNIPAQLSGVANAYRRQSPTIEGPLTLVQGGRGYIMHYPVFERPTGLGAPRFWGVISIVFQPDRLFEPHQNPHQAADYTYSLRAFPTGAIPPEIEPSALDDDDPVRTRFELLGKTWKPRHVRLTVCRPMPRKAPTLWPSRCLRPSH